ncbi:negative regulation of double-strand break repair via homologous recombination, partial [Basidiobolus ranarum]
MTSPLTRAGCETLRQQALESLEEAVENGSSRPSPPELNVRLQVMKLLRYTIDSRARSFFENVIELGSSTVDVFDMIISDAAHKLKVVLSPELNYMVYQGLICERAVIEVHDCTLRFRETDLSATEIIVLTKINIVDYHVSKLYKKKGREDIEYLVEVKDEYLPFTSRRRSYLTALGDDDFLR